MEPTILAFLSHVFIPQAIIERKGAICSWHGSHSNEIDISTTTTTKKNGENECPFLVSKFLGKTLSLSPITYDTSSFSSLS